MARIASLKEFVDDELDRSADLVRRVHAESLRHAGASANRAALVASMQPFCDAFVAALRERALGPRTAAPPTGPARAPALELLDEAAVDADIEISRVMQQIDTVAEWELRELRAFTSALDARQHVGEDVNPLRPAAYAWALWQAVCTVVSSHAQRSALMRACGGELAQALRLAWAASCTRLEAQGVEPSMYRTSVQPSPSVRGALGFASRPAAAGSDGRAPLLTGLVGEMPVRPGSVSSPRAQVEALMDRLFDVVAEDHDLPLAVRELLARLHEPLRRSAVHDASLLERADHPGWQLLELIAGSVAPGAAPDADAAALLREGHRVADALGKEMLPSAAQLRQGLLHLQRVADARADERLREAQPLIERLRRAEQREDLAQRFRGWMVAKLAQAEVSAGVHDFLVEHWSRLLAQLTLDHGDQDPRTRAGLATVDDLLWSIDPPDHPQSRQRLLKMLPGLLQQLRGGMAEIALAPAAQQALLDELMVIHTAALQPRPAGAATAEQRRSQQIVQRMRDEVLPAGQAGGGFGDSLIDVGSMDTVPAELMAGGGEGAPVAGSATAAVDAIAEGATRRLFLNGRWTTAHLLWRSPRGRYLVILLDDGRAQGVSRRALERLHAAGLLAPVAQQPLLQRAAARLQRQLGST